MQFGEAINLLREVKAATRTSWNGKNMFIIIVNGCMLPVKEGSHLSHFIPVGTKVECPSHIAMFTAQRTLIPWVASQTDMLAGDWEECIGVLL